MVSLLHVLPALLRAVSAAPDVVIGVNASTGAYIVSIGGAPWYEGKPPIVCQSGVQLQLIFASVRAVSGDDGFGAWTGDTTAYVAAGSNTSAPLMELTFKHYAARPQLVVGTAAFPQGLNTSGCGANTDLSTQFPAFDTAKLRASEINTLSWRGGVIATTAAARGLGALGASGLDCGPVVSVDPETGDGFVVSTLDHHKIFPQKTYSNGAWAMGVAGAIPSLPAGWNHSVVFAAAAGGATAVTYAWGSLVQEFHGISYAKRLPSVTLTDVGYYTDDGAYYYVWGGGKETGDPQLSKWIGPRPWPAEEGLLLVRDQLVRNGVPVAYMQLDDWWYQGPFYFGNVKSVVDWHAANGSGLLFPGGMPAFADKLALPLQLYTPFFNDAYQTKARTFESTSFHKQKLPVPDDSRLFFDELFDLGLKLTNGRFNTYEIDFLDDNFRGCAGCFEDVGAADRWYRGMADSALERNISIQYCLPSATDMLAALTLPAVVQARASGDYARPEGSTTPWGNVVTLGGASLLLGATAIAPSKDTLWTSSPQPPTSSDRTTSGYKTQPHVALDAILATLSLGPVGISDGLNETDVGLISQAFRSASDGTLLRPSRPLSTVDAVWSNHSNATPTPAPAPVPTPAPYLCVLGRYVGCYAEPGHYVTENSSNIDTRIYNFSANNAAGLPPNDPTMTREKCATLCGAYVAQHLGSDKYYAAIEASDQCFCGAVDPSAASGKKVADSACNMPCKADSQHNCGGDWKADVYAIECSAPIAVPASVDPRTSTSDDIGADDLFAPSLHAADAGRAVLQGKAADVRATHAALGKGDGSDGPNSHYILTWMTTYPVTLQRTDLYPAPNGEARLAVRKHIVAPAGAAQYAGCNHGSPAVPSCVDVLPAGTLPTLPPVASKVSDITAFGYWSVYEPVTNGAYFLGELSKFVHVSPQRFTHVRAGRSGACGLSVGVRGSEGEELRLVAIDMKGIVHIANITIPSTGDIEVSM